MSQPLHATITARWIAGEGWRGVLIRGASGAGKSDLALRLIGQPGWRLVADDYAHVFASGDALYATAPVAIAGRIEARGAGLLAVCRRDLVRLVLVVELTDEALERLPEPDRAMIEGVALPMVRLNPFEESAAQKVTRLTSPL